MSCLIVIAKAPVPGQVKTRLTPPCSPEQAASIAGAALADTLQAVRSTPADRRMLALDGPPSDWVGDGFDIVPQRGKDFAERLAAAFDDAGGPALVVAMDTPQITPALLLAGLDSLADHDAALGPTTDGGYWTIGLRNPDPAVFIGVPMSTKETARAQRQRLDELGLSRAELPELTDVDDIASARTVAAGAPHTRFAAALRESGHAADEQQAVPKALP